MVVALLGITTVNADAETDLGQFCWTQAPTFDDTFRCSVQQASGAVTDMFHMYCRIRSAGTQYQLVGAGLATSNPFTGGVQVAIATGNQSTLFRNHDHCMWQATLDSSLNGTMTVQCVGGALSPFNSSAPLTFTSCSDATMVDGAASGRGIGEVGSAEKHPCLHKGGPKGSPLWSRSRKHAVGRVSPEAGSPSLEREILVRRQIRVPVIVGSSARREPTPVRNAGSTIAADIARSWAHPIIDRYARVARGGRRFTTRTHGLSDSLDGPSPERLET